jgi:hypothetical protein
MMLWFWPSNRDSEENCVYGRILFGAVQKEKENGAFYRLYVTVHCCRTVGSFPAQIGASVLLLGL